MKSKCLGIAFLAIMGLASFASSPAMATTLEVGGVTKTSAINPELSLAGTVWVWKDTSGISANSCPTSLVKFSDSTSVTGTTVSGPVSSMSWTSCSEGNPTVDAAGTLSIERIGTTTNGTVRSNGIKLTLPSFFGPLTCTTSNTDFGTLTGVASGSAKLDGHAVLSCTVVGSIVAEGVYVVTNPSGTGVTG